MDNIYLILVVVLFALAISDLIVGVSNDAVNFLNSAVGAKAGKIKIIILVAALGVFVGAIFSSGMMEVARKGIFNPDMFYFREVMFLFLAVMITDVILLDFFNTIGFPTSTTVSLVFELLGASIGVALFKITHDASAVSDIGAYINSASALKIISAILISVGIAFFAGAIMQYIVRLIFSFDYQKQMKRYGAIYIGASITLIVYFLLIKGLKGASFMTPEMSTYVKSHTQTILLFNFIGWTIISQLFLWFTRVNMLKFLVFLGTFALAMAFAGNDLVNFIGVPMAGYESYKIWIASGQIDPEVLSMSGLKGTLQSSIFFLLIAGLIMVIALATSKKAKTVINTSVNLGRQFEGDEQFSSSYLAKSIVRGTLNISNKLDRITPNPVKAFIQKRFSQTAVLEPSKDAPAFDMLRAANILVVSSALIALGTSLKLPLSTTYVTFLVAMAASLADKSWGRESAVYRVTGVLSVIGGWFITAFAAFTIAFILAYLFSLTHFTGVMIMIALAIFIVVRTHYIHKKREKSKEAASEMGIFAQNDKNKGVFDQCANTLSTSFESVSTNYKSTINCLINEDRKTLKKVLNRVREFNHQTKLMKDNVTDSLKHLNENAVENGHYYVQMIDYLREIGHSMNFIVSPAYTHLDNNHKPLNESQIAELKHLSNSIVELYDFIRFLIKERKFSELEMIITKQQEILDEIALYKKNHIKRIQKAETGTKNSMLFFEILAETKNLILYSINSLKAQRDFFVKSAEIKPNIEQNN